MPKTQSTSFQAEMADLPADCSVPDKPQITVRPLEWTASRLLKCDALKVWLKDTGLSSHSLPFVLYTLRWHIVLTLTHFCLPSEDSLLEEDKSKRFVRTIALILQVGNTSYERLFNPETMKRPCFTKISNGVSIPLLVHSMETSGKRLTVQPSLQE